MKQKKTIQVLCVVLSFSANVFAVSNYDIILPSYPPNGTLNFPTGLNDLNQIVGPVDAFWGGGYRWQSGTRTALSVDFGMSGGMVTGINDEGDIIGRQSADGPGFLLKNTTLILLGTLGGRSSSPFAVNDNTQIVGTSQTTTVNELRPFLWQNNTMISLGTLGGNNGWAYDINNHGVVVGFSHNASGDTKAFIYRNSTMTDLGTLGGSQSNAVAINDANQIVGWSEMANGYQHAFIWQNGTMTDLGTLGGNQSQAFDVNNNGQILGWAETATGYRPLVIWENGVAVRLNSLIATDSGWELVMTGGVNMDEKPFYCINNSGAILGTGFVNGNSHSFLMLPRVDDFFLHDSNHDGSVNLQDFVQMSKEWMK